MAAKRGIRSRRVIWASLAEPSEDERFLVYSRPMPLVFADPDRDEATAEKVVSDLRAAGANHELIEAAEARVRVVQQEKNGGPRTPAGTDGGEPVAVR